MTPILDYFYGNQADQFTFYRIPKLLFTSPEYRNISAEAKILYGLLLDRMTLSARSGWFDEFNRVFIIFTIGDIMEALGCATQKAAKLLSELEEKAGLIERRRQGLGKPNIIYVKNFVTEESKIKNCENQNSGVLKIENQEFPESKSNNTDKNNTDINDTDSLLFPSVRGDQRREAARCDAQQREEYREIVLENIEYEILESSPGTDTEILDEIVELIVDTVSTARETVLISGEEKSAEVVRSQFLKLTRYHIEYVMDSLRDNSTRVRNIKQYMLASLYNAPMTMGSYYQSRVNSDAADGVY